MQSQLQTRLSGLRSKIRFIQCLSGLARFCLTVFGLVAATYLLDRGLRLPFTVRAVLLVTGVGLCLWVLRGFLLRPLRRPLDDQCLADGVEASHPELADRLRSALDFQRAMEEDTFPESRTLARAVVADTLERTRSLNFARVARFRRVLPLAAMCVLAACVLLMGFTLTEGGFNVWFKRCVCLSTTEIWPRTTALRVLMPPAGSAVYVTREDGRTVFNLARGLDFTLNVVADRGDPVEVKLHFDPLPGSGSDSTTGTRALPRVQTGRYATTFERLTRSFAFHVTGGDDDDARPQYGIRVLHAPAVGEVRVQADFPPYTGRPRVTYPRGDVEVPCDTRLTFFLEATQPLTEAWLCTGEANGDRKPLDRIDDRRFKGRLRAGSDFDYTFDLTGLNRIRNHNRVRYRVTTVPDRAPTLRNLRPRSAQVDVTPGGVLALLVRVHDDHGTRAARILVQRRQNRRILAIQDEDRLNGGDDGDVQGTRAFHLFRHLEIADLRVAKAGRNAGERAPMAGDMLRLSIEVEDNHQDRDGVDRPNLGRSKVVRVEVVAAGDLERRINDRQLRIKEDVRKIVAYQERTRSEAGDLQVLLGKTTGLEEIAERILTVERRQNRVTADLGGVLSGLKFNLDAFAYNRLETSPAVNRVLDIFARETRQNPGQDTARFQALVEASREGTLGKSDALEKLIRMTGLAMDAAEEASPAAARALSRCRAGAGPGAMLESIKATLAHQDRTLEILKSLTEGLEDWEDYQEVVQLNKELIDLQKEIKSRTEDMIRKNK